MAREIEPNVYYQSRADNLQKAVDIYRLKCASDKVDCDDCPLNKPVNEHSEHPTFCEMLTEVNDKFTGN